MSIFDANVSTYIENDMIRAFITKKYYILLTLIRPQEVEHILFLGKRDIDCSLKFPSRLLQNRHSHSIVDIL